MTQPSTAEVQQLIQAGRAAALAGDMMAARDSFRRAAELDPASVEAWLGLSGAVPILAERREHLRRALELDPGNAEARVGLAEVERLEAAGLRIAPSPRRAPPAPVDAAQAPAPAAEAQTLFCYRHPDRETGLRCVQCERPICGACAQITNVGQLCPECRKSRRPANYQPGAGHVAIGAGLGLGLGLLANIVLPLVLGLPFLGLILALLSGPLTGEIAVRGVERLTHGKRGRRMQIAVGAGLVVGVLPLLGLTVLRLLLGAGGALLPGLLVGLWLVLAVTTAATRLK